MGKKSNTFPQKDGALKPGLYFGMDDKQYLSDSAISRGVIVDIQEKSPIEVWANSWMNPAPKVIVDTEPMKFGRAYHACLLEPESYRQRYCVGSSDRFDASKTYLSRDVDEAIQDGKRKLLSDSDVAEMLSGGYPEVVIVWPHYSGIMLRSRHDYFHPSMSIELKSTARLQNDSLKHEFRRYKYPMQEVFYTEGRREIRQLINSGQAKVYGKVDGKFLNRFLAQEEDGFKFIVQQKDWPRAFLKKHMTDYDKEAAMADLEEGIAKYAYYIRKYGTKQWPACDELLDEEFSLQHGSLLRSDLLWQK